MTNYGGSIIVGSIVLAIVALIIVKGVRDKRAGKHSCSCGGDCASCGCCKSKNPQK
ncbi:MAG: FeoB-associated Cys-rich membrane protein [Oscillospiraceae bacterium]|nr:FeoB-associated Cys-rich membrane protein [Oscillospiraceae bacterium]